MIEKVLNWITNVAISIILFEEPKLHAVVAVEIYN